MSVLERKDLVTDNSYQHLLSTYSLPGALPGLFPGMASFNFCSSSIYVLHKEPEAEEPQRISRRVLGGASQHKMSVDTGEVSLSNAASQIPYRELTKHTTRVRP